MNLLRMIFRRKGKKDEGMSAADMMPEAENYTAFFEAACHRTADLGLGENALPSGLQMNLDERFSDSLQRHVRDIVTDMLGGQAQNMAGQCFTINLELAKRLTDDGFGVSVTWGSVYEMGRGRLFGVDTKDVEKIVRSPEGGTSLDMHSWLTLPSMEVVDVTILPSIAMVSGDMDLLGRALMGPPENLAPFRFLPQLVGGEFPLAAGMVTAFII